MANTQPIIQRGGLLPLLRYGNYAGPGYAGGMGAETLIQHPRINNGKPIAAGALAQTPDGLASFMQLALQTPPNGYIDSVTRQHDVEYTVAEIRFMQAVQSRFEGRLPCQLTGQDQLERAYKQLQAACDAEYWQADQRMLRAVADYHPTDFADATYRALMLNAFYTKAESSIFGYGLGRQVDDFYDSLKQRDPDICVPSFFDSFGALGSASTLARADLEALVTLPITPQERQFFNQHLRSGHYIDASTQDDEGNLLSAETMDFSNRIVVPCAVDDHTFTAQVWMGDEQLSMRLDKTDPQQPVFVCVTSHQGEVLSMQTLTPVDDGASQVVPGVRAYREVITDDNGRILQTRIIPRPQVPALPTPPDLQRKIAAVVSGEYGRVVQLPPATMVAHVTNRVAPVVGSALFGDRSAHQIADRKASA